MTPIDTHKGLIAWFARNHVAANLLMAIIILTGLISVLTIRTQIAPDIEFNSISIEVPFPGASPGEVESSVVSRIEEAVRDIEGIDEMKSYSSKGSGRLQLVLKNGYEVSVVMDEVKMAVDRISGLPTTIEQPRIYRNQPRSGAINVQIYGDMEARSRKIFAEQIRDELLNLPSVTKVEINGTLPYEVSIELEEARLRQYGLTLGQVAQAINRSSLDLGAGSIQTDAGDILLRTEGQAYTKYDFEQIVLVSRMDGTRLTLADIATVSDGFVDVEFHAIFNGMPSIGLSVFAVADQNQIDISNEVKAYVKQRRATLPAGIHLEQWADSTAYLNSTMNMMVSNMLSGIILVLVVLGLFLRLQLAFWVMLGLPIAFLGAFALLPLAGGSVNMISLFGFILVLGIVVDDAIIIGESVQSATDDDEHNIDNVIIGAQRVAIPATFGVLTTIATFIPLMLVPGTFGAMPAAIGLVVILCLVFSIVESKLILPAHLASMKPLPKKLPGESMNLLERFQSNFASHLRRVIYDYYQPLLLRAIEHRYVTLASFIGILILALGFVFSPYLKTVMFPNMASNYIRANIELTEGSSPKQIVRIIRTMEDSLLALNESKPEGEKFLKNYFAYSINTRGQFIVEMAGGDQVTTDPEVVSAQWRALVGDIAGTKTLEIAGSEKSHGQGRDVAFTLVSHDSVALKAAAELLAQQLVSYAGVYDVENSGKGNIPELNLTLKPSAETLGLSLSDLANQVRAAFYGIEAQRIQRAREEVRVMVRYPKSERESLGNLESMFIRTQEGDEIPFSVVAEIEERVSPAVITRTWGKRSVRVSANVDKAITQPGRIVQDITLGEFQTELKQMYPSVRIELGGASKEASDLQQRMLFTGALALFAIYALMAIPLRSYLQPIIIMGVIPFGMIGAVIGHILVGIEFSALSLFGIIALAGVVVNDSIIMVDFVNKSVAEGVSIPDAAVQAGTKRFRAIMLTSLTTFFGLLPILLETSFAAQLVVPMAVSLGFGILFATIITLILIPCLYVILNDIQTTRLSLSANRPKTA